MVEDHEVQVGW